MHKQFKYIILWYMWVNLNRKVPTLINWTTGVEFNHCWKNRDFMFILFFIFIYFLPVLEVYMQSE